MTLNIKLKRSATLNSAPTAAQLEDGELGINYNAASIALYAKDSAGTIRKIAGQGAEGSYWELASNVLSPESNAYGVEIGSGNISLNADGSVVSGPISTQNNTSAVNYLWRKTTTAGDAVLRCKSNVTLTTGADPFAVLANGNTEISGDLVIGGTLPSAPNITLNALDGSATFNSTGQFGGSWSNDDSPQVRAFIGSNVGSVRVKGSASGGAGSNAFGVYAGGSSASSQTYGVYYDGHVEIGGLIGSAPNISLNADGSAKLTRVASTYRTSFTSDLGTPTQILDGTGVSSSAGRNNSIMFRPSSNTIATINGVCEDTTSATALTFQTRSSGGTTSEVLRLTSSGNVLIGGTLPSAPNISLNADGSAELTNDLILRRSSSVYALLDANSSVDLDITVNAGRANTEGRVKFRGSRGGGNLATRSLITAAGDIYVGGTLDATAGSEAPNIQLKSDGNILSGGISFNGNTVDANTLGDYEEGDATIATFTGNSTGSNNVSGSYVKIGTKVFCTGSAVVSPNTDSSITEVFFSLPFSKKSGTGVNGNITVVSVRTGARPIFGEQTLGVSNSYGVDDALKDAITIGSYDYGVAVQISYSYIAAT